MFSIQVKEIEWNSDSSVLALWLEPLKKEEVEAHTSQPQRQSETRDDRTRGNTCDVQIRRTESTCVCAGTIRTLWMCVSSVHVFRLALLDSVGTPRSDHTT